jgi:hypothetical protein
MSRTQEHFGKSKLARSDKTFKERLSAVNASNPLSIQGHSYKH